MVAFATAAALMVPAISMTKGDLDAPEQTGSSIATQAVEDDAAAEGQAVEDVSETEEADAESADNPEDAATTDEAAQDPEDPESVASDNDSGAESEESADEQPDEESQDPEQDAENDKAAADEQTPMPAQTLYGELRDKNDKVTLTVDVEAPEGALPEGTTMQVQAVKAKEIKDAVEKALTKEDAGTLDKVQAVDITFLDADDQPIEPAAPVNVKLTSKQIAKAVKADQQPLIAHIDDEGKAELVDTLTDDELADRDITRADNELLFDADAFSVYAIVYTVDFHYDVDGKTYDFSIPGGGFVSLSDLVAVLGLANDVAADAANAFANSTPDQFVAAVEKVEFSSPNLLSVNKVEKDTTVGAFKKSQGLNCEYSEELTQDQIDDINAQPLQAGDWVLISHAPFESEETLTVTMKTGEVFTVQVTDAAINVSKDTDPSIGHILYYQDGGTYYVLKTDGTTVTCGSTEEMDALSTEYQWTVTYVYVEDGVERYNIRPFTDKTTSLALNHPNQPLVGDGPNNITVVPTSEGANTYTFGGYNNTKLVLQGGEFVGSDAASTAIQIYNLEPLHKYTFTVQTNNSSMGKVSGTDVSGAGKTKVERFTTSTNNVSNASDPKTNQYAITAVPDTTITGTDGKSKYIFDHWELNGKVLYQGANGTAVTEYSGSEPAKYVAEIPAGKLTLPENACTLTAVFKEDPNYKAKDEDKQGTPFSDMDSWLKSLVATNTPISDGGTKKTAEVYDYENRIYRVDLTAQSNLRTFNGNLDLGFVLDVSGSMKFPSKLIPANVPSAGSKVDIWKINDDNYDSWNNEKQRWNKYWETWGLDTNKTYYIIAEADTRATVFRIHYNTSKQKWYRVDSSYVNGDSTNDKEINSSVKFGVEESGNGFTYLLYEDGDYPHQRLTYEQSSLSNTISSLKELITALTLVKDTGQNPNAKNPDARIAWNTFCANIPKWHPSFTSVTSNETIISNGDYAYDGGTRTDLALGTTDEGINNGGTQVSKHAYGAYNFDWNTSNKSNYVILITDGAPQYGQGQNGPSTKTGKERLKENTDTLVEKVKENIGTLRQDKKVKVITVGLSMDDVEQGRKMLYDIADTVNGERMFYSAESGDQLEDILLHIIDTIMVDATVVGNVSDTIGEAFYPVDLKTGRILGNNDEIDLNGNCVTGDSSYTGPRGKIIKDGDTYKAEWNGQDIPQTGWHGTVYVKACEDFLGGNAVVTNNDAAGEAKVTATDYKLPGSNTTYPLADKAYTLDDSGNKVENTNYKLSKEMSTPRVNVNELYIGEKKSDWTVYLGTEVDPKQQMIALYNSIPVEETVKKGGATDTNGDGLPDILVDGGDQSKYNFTMEESISDQRSKLEDEPETFLLKDLIKTLVNPGGSSEWWDYSAETLNWDELIRMANLENQNENTGFTIKYNKYGMRDEGHLNIKLTKAVVAGEKGIDESPHATTVVGDDVEKYTLTVLYEPDYDTPPEGQGGKPGKAKEYKTGGFGTAYQGHAAGKELRNTTHEINVYAKPLDVLKLDKKNKTLPGATFALYRAAKEGESPVENDLTKYDAALTGDYFKISEGTSDDDGIVHLANTGNDGKTRLAAGETYYLIETGVPEGYERETAYKVVTVEVDENGTYTTLDNQALNEKTYPFNWDQGSLVKVDDSVVPLDANGEQVGMAGKDYLKDDEVAVFRTKVFNALKNISLDVEKKWTDANDNVLNDHPDKIEFKLYRVSHKTCNHEWTVVPAGCETDGSRTCTICNTTEPIPATGHAWGEWTIVQPAQYNQPGLKKRVCANDPTHVQQEEYSIEGHEHVYGDWVVTTPATCEGEGVQTRYCNICLEPDPVTQAIPALGHDYQMTSMTPATCTTNGSKTFTCSHDTSHTYTDTIAATGHDWGEWVVTTPATTSASGVETRYCANDPSHVETREIPQLEGAATVTFNVNKRIDGEYYNVDYKTVSVSYPVGTRIRIEWTYPNGYSAPDAWFKKNASRLFVKNYGDKGCYILTGARMPYVEINKPFVNGQDSKYSFEVDVAENLVIDICLENSWDKALPTPTITVVNQAGTSSVSPSGKRLAAAKRGMQSALKAPAAVAQDAASAANAGESDAKSGAQGAKGTVSSGHRASATVLTAEQLKVLLAKYPTREQAQDQYDVDVIEELDSTYKITADDSWKKTIEDLPRRDADGNEYTYYVVETSPAAGYLTSYDGESGGLQDGDKVTITNKRVEVDIEILKLIKDTKTPLPGAKFTLTLVDENGHEVDGGIVRTNLVSGADGKIAVDNIVPGRYKLEETEPPAGYVKSEGPYYINVSADGTGSVEGTVVYASVDGHTFTIENEPGVALPHTGGPGTMPLYAVGAALVAFAGFALARRLAAARRSGR